MNALSVFACPVLFDLESPWGKSFPMCSELITIKLPPTLLASIMAQRCSLGNIVSDVAFILDALMCVSHGIGTKRASGSSSMEGSWYRGMSGKVLG